MSLIASEVPPSLRGQSKRFLPGSDSTFDDARRHVSVNSPPTHRARNPTSRAPGDRGEPSTHNDFQEKIECRRESRAGIDAPGRSGSRIADNISGKARVVQYSSRSFIAKRAIVSSSVVTRTPVPQFVSRTYVSRRLHSLDLTADSVRPRVSRMIPSSRTSANSIDSIRYFFAPSTNKHYQERVRKGTKFCVKGPPSPSVPGRGNAFIVVSKEHSVAEFIFPPRRSLGLRALLLPRPKF